MRYIALLMLHLPAFAAAFSPPASIHHAQRRQQNQTACPNVHVFGARETTAPPGFGSALSTVKLIQQANGRSTSEPIVYPAAGGARTVYAESVAAGIAAVTSQTDAFNRLCPRTKIVMVGYSQGAQIVDDAFCGGPDGLSLTTTGASVSPGVRSQVAAIILMGNPRHVDGLPFNVGNATESGFAARPSGFQCPEFQNMIQAYCDEEDPFCAKGNNPVTHQSYGMVYGQQALDFVQQRLNGVRTSDSFRVDRHRVLAAVSVISACFFAL